ncbi:hypothetical protein HpBGD63_05190 [Helicobacter pylori]
MVGKVALKKTLGILAGPIGWVITGALVSINLAGPAYRVTVARMRFGCHLTPKTESVTRSEIESGTNKTISKNRKQNEKQIKKHGI